MEYTNRRVLDTKLSKKRTIHDWILVCANVERLYVKIINFTVQQAKHE